MKDRDKIILGIGTIAIAAALYLFLKGKKKKEIKLYRSERIADEGYETAGDILFPIRYKFGKERMSLN